MKWMQTSFIELVPSEDDKEQKDKPRNCSFHPWVKDTDFIKVTVKSTGKTVKRCNICELNKLENKKIASQDWEREKQNLTDYYVRRTLAQSNRAGFKMHDYPQELVDAVKTIKKLDRVIKEKEEKEIVKICIWHGELSREEVVKQGYTVEGEERYRCKECMHQSQKQNYEMHKKKIALKQRIYREENKEKVSESKKRSKLKHKDRHREKNRIYCKDYRLLNLKKERLRDQERKRLDRAELKDSYLKRQIVKSTSLNKEDLTPEFIETVRALKFLRRGIKLEQLNIKLTKPEKENDED